MKRRTKVQNQTDDFIKYNGTGEEDEICYISEVGLFLEG